MTTSEELNVEMLAAEGIKILAVPVRLLNKRLGSLVVLSICEAQALTG
jgi:hypothetical protein